MIPDPKWRPDSGVIRDCACRGDIEGVKKCLESGESIETRSSYGHLYETPLIVAADYGHYDLVKYLLRKGADVNAVSKQGWTALIHACRNNDVKIIRLLVDHGAGMGRESDAWTPLTMCARMGHLSSFTCLLDLGARLDVYTDYDAKYYAAEYGHYDIVRVIEDWEAKDTNGALLKKITSLLRLCCCAPPPYQ